MAGENTGKLLAGEKALRQVRIEFLSCWEWLKRKSGRNDIVYGRMGRGSDRSESGIALTDDDITGVKPFFCSRTAALQQGHSLNTGKLTFFTLVA